MTRKSSFFENVDKIWVYSGLFGIFLILHYFTPYYQRQPVPNFVRSVVIAPLFEEFIYRFLGILIAFYSINKIPLNESINKKIYWGMVFIISVYLEIGTSVLKIQNYLSINSNYLTLVFSFIYLGVLLLLPDYKLKIIILISSFNWALIHENFRIFPVFIAGLFFSILSINRSRISLFNDQNKWTIMFLLIYGAFVGYLIHFWNNLLNWALYQKLNPFLIDVMSLTGVVFCLFLLQTFVNPFIDERFKINLYHFV